MRKNTLAVAIASGLILTACGGGSSSDTGKPVLPISTTALSGVINKGIVLNGSVEICDVFDSTGCNKEQSAFYQETVTNDKGAYLLTGAPTGIPLLVFVSKKDASTLMKCDIAVCDDTTTPNIVFGDTFEVANDWNLKTIIPMASGNNAKVHVTSLTDIAAEEAFSIAGSSAITTTIGLRANSAVQQSFGLTRSILGMGGIDLTDASALKNANAEDLAAATYSAALLTVTDEEKKSLIDLNANKVNVSKVQEILTKSSDLIDVIEANANKHASSDERVDLTQAKQKIDVTEPPEEVQSGGSEHANEILAAKSFMQDVRSAYESVQDEGNLRNGLENFGERLEVLGSLNTEDSEIVLKEVGKSISAITEAVQAISNLPEDSEVSSPYYSSHGIVVEIQENTFNVDYDGIEISATIDKISVDNDIIETAGCTVYDAETNQCEHSETTSVAVELEVNITATSNGTTLTGEGEIELNGLTNTSSLYSYDFANGASNVSIKHLEQLQIENLNLILRSSLVNNDIDSDFKGEIKLSLEDILDQNISEYESSQVVPTSYDFNYSRTETVLQHASAIGILLEGELSIEQESVSALLDLRFTNDRGTIISDINITRGYCGYWHCSTTSTEQNQSRPPQNESSSNFTRVYAVIEVETELNDAQNEAMPASVKLEAHRESYESGEIALTVDYNGVDTILESSIDVNSEEVPNLVIRNENSVEAVLDIENKSGIVKVNDVTVGTIDESRHGLVLIRYTDGSFESLF
ncbi:hypothetical protein Q8W40_06390 [Vibrio penaeicida]|uniref:hypothetical protein n=1 Tax=Vibrio penaeicida TaxID=104609 RepID=UPI002736784A|nr:hypothetical protein [Vibrio penaeicida]MDP2571799.1 hypothetical protein [Vibrio penaeicida]